MHIVLRIPYPNTKKGRAEWSKKYGLNAYWAGKHWSRRKADAEYWHALVRSEIRKQGIKGHMDKPFSVEMRWNDRLDIDNHAAIAKMIVDALKGVVIQDDDRRWFKRISHAWHDEDYILVTIEEQR